MEAEISDSDSSSSSGSGSGSDAAPAKKAATAKKAAASSSSSSSDEAPAKKPAPAKKVPPAKKMEAEISDAYFDSDSEDEAADSAQSVAVLPVAPVAEFELTIRARGAAPERGQYYSLRPSARYCAALVAASALSDALTIEWDRSVAAVIVTASRIPEVKAGDQWVALGGRMMHTHDAASEMWAEAWRAPQSLMFRSGPHWPGPAALE